MPATIQPIHQTWNAQIYVGVSCANSSGTAQGGMVPLDQIDYYGALPRPPWLQSPEFTFSVKGGETNTISIYLTQSSNVTGLSVGVVDAQWEVCKR